MNRIKSGCWNNLSIQKKLMTIIVVLIIGISVFSVYLISTTYGYIKNFNSNTNEYFKINTLYQFNEGNNRLITQYLDDFQLESLAEYNNNVDAFYSNLTEVEAKPQSLEAYLLLRSINNSFTYYLEECNAAIIKKSGSDSDYLVHYFNSTRANKYMEAYISQLLKLKLYEGSMEYSRLVAEAQTMKYVSIGVISAFLILYMLLGAALSKSITEPIKHLAEQSKRMSEGELDVEILKIERNDEVGTLTRSFNKMSRSIRRMINDLKTKAKIEKKLIKEELINAKNKELLKEAKFLALQSQINPHFLFNTLNTISREVTFGHQDEAVQLIKSMSSLLRYNMGDGDTHVTLKNELQIVKRYFHIQQHRFKERLEVDIQCAGVDVDMIMIPCFTLQPIVENAIIHGLEPKVEGGKIRIKVCKKGRCAIIKVIDNGIGIEESRIKIIMSEKSGHTRAIGVANVRDRLRIFCGNNKCFALKSKVGIGTVAIIQIPMNKEMNNV